MAVLVQRMIDAQAKFKDKFNYDFNYDFGPDFTKAPGGRSSVG